MITLRENQTEPINKAIQFFTEKKPKPSLIVLPTAWGKSILTAFVAKNSNDKMIVLQPSKELLEQNYLKYCSLCGDFALNAGIYSASFGRKDIAHITYATIGSIKSLGAKFKSLGFTKMLIDEAHLYPREANSMLGRFLKESGITHVLGITATPVKLQTNRDKDGQNFSKLVMLTSRSKKGNFFKDIIHVGQVAEMVRLGFWSPLQYETAGFDSSLLVFNSSKSEYTEESVQRAYDANGGSEQIVQALDRHSDRRHILVFVPSVEDAITLSKKYPNSAVIYGEMDKTERSQVIARATRIDPEKTDALIVDLGGNVERFGRVEDITFEQGKMWRMFGTGGRLLSGIPISDIGHYTREDTRAIDARAEAPIEIMPFGKYKGNRIADIPLDYRQWMIRSFEWNARNEKLRKSILTTL